MPQKLKASAAILVGNIGPWHTYDDIWDTTKRSSLMQCIIRVQNSHARVNESRRVGEVRGTYLSSELSLSLYIYIWNANSQS